MLTKSITPQYRLIEFILTTSYYWGSTEHKEIPQIHTKHIYASIEKQHRRLLEALTQWKET